MNSQPQRATIKTIAQETGLSTATVSKALKSSPQVRPETRALIHEAAKRLGYQANMHGVQLRTGRTYQIAVVMMAPAAREEEWEGVEYAQMLSGISMAIEPGPYRMTLFAVRDPAESFETIRQIVTHRKADGIVIAGTRPEDKRIAFLQEADFPFVTYGLSELPHPHAYVDTDNEGMMRACIERLIAKGHRRIALLNPPAEYTYARTRMQTYAHVLAAHNIALDEALVAHAHLTPAFGRAQVIAMADLPDPPTAYVCANEAAALGAMSGFHAKGLVHGRDAIINATDDINVSAYFSPPITTFYLPIHKPSTMLGEFIVRRIEGEPPQALQKLFMPSLIERYDDILR